MVITQRRWHLCHRFDPIYKSWEGETAVFDRFSGNTHLIDDLSLEIVRLLSSSSKLESELVNVFAQMKGLECDEALIEGVGQRLGALSQLGIARVDSI